MENRVVSFNDGEQLAKLYNMKFFETSAKTNQNISECFLQLSQLIKDNILIPE